MREDYGASITSSEYAIAIDPKDPEGLLSKANGLFRLDNYEEALNYYERYNCQMPFDEFGLLHQGTCLINLSRYEEAAQRLKKALDVAPPDSPYLVEIYQELGFAYCELHLPETAIHYLDKTDNLECDHLDMLVIKGHILLANKRIEEAESMFKKAILESGNAPKTILRIMVSLYDNRYVEASYKMFKRFFEIVDKDWNDGYSYMALCCWDMKKIDEFLHYLRLAVKHNPQEARVVLSQLFPKDLKPEEYYQYIIQEIRK
jgi:tetratricopeptide (TPR) repeat protein